MIASIEGQRALRALRRGANLDQFLGYADPSGPPGIAWLTVGPWFAPETPRGFMVTLFEVVEVHDPFDRPSLERMPALDKSLSRNAAPCRDLGLRTTPRAALEFAESATGASRDRWVTLYKLEDQYEEWVSAGRPPLR
jgi:hypothetical protein